MSEVLPARVEPTTRAAKRAWKAQQQIVQRVQEMRRAWIELARDLHEFDEQRQWKDLGYSSFGQWMADPDVEIERSTGYLLVSIWREMVLNAGADPAQLAQVDLSKVQNVVAAVRRKFISAEDALADCRTLSRHDLRRRYLLGGVPSENGVRPDTGTSYLAEQEPVYQTCVVCGSRYEVKGT